MPWTSDKGARHQGRLTHRRRHISQRQAAKAIAMALAIPRASSALDSQSVCPAWIGFFDLYQGIE